MSSRLWRIMPIETVPVASLLPTQEGTRPLGTLRALLGLRTRHGTREREVCVVRWRGAHYLEDGHHRVAAARWRGRRAVTARVLEPYE